MKKEHIKSFFTYLRARLGRLFLNIGERFEVQLHQNDFQKNLS